MQEKTNYLLTLAFILFISTGAVAQSSVFGIKGGPVIATQNWSNFQRTPLVDIHAIAFIESWAEDEPNVLFAQLGFHTRGSSLRQVFLNPNLGFSPQTRSFKFFNLALTAGAKRKLYFGDRYTPYYTLGIRGEYTLYTNLNEFRIQNQTSVTSYPQNEFVVPFMYGVYAGGGIEFKLTELIGGLLEFSVNPDLSRQYFQPPLTNVINPVTGMTIPTLAQREIRNVTLEVTFGFRFLRKVVYID